MHLPSPLRVAVMIEMSTAYGRGLIRGIAEFAQRQTQWSLDVGDVGTIDALPEWMCAWSGAGVIGRIESGEIAAQLLAKGIPLVNVSGRNSPPGVPHIDLDNGGVCKLALDYFLQRGIQHVAYCGDPRFQWSVWRREHFARQAAATSASWNVFDGGETAPEQQRMAEWLAGLPKPVAILACNDRRGCALLETCRRLGLSVPQDVAVLGVDNDELLCTIARPQLSSIVPDPESIGYFAAQTLHEMLLGQTPEVMERWVPPLSVCNRQSTDTTVVDDWHVSQSLRIIEGQAANDLSVDDLVQRMRTSRRYLEKRFRVVLGSSIHDEIMRVRLVTAQRLLSTTKLPFKDVAVRSGLRRADYLSAVFRDKLGLSPKEYRARHQNGDAE